MPNGLPFAEAAGSVWSPVARKIHKAVWDHAGLDVVQSHVRRWAADWQRRYKEAEASAEATEYEPAMPELPLPPSHERPLSLDEKWASLAAVHDVYYPYEKISPWPLPDCNRPLDNELAEEWTDWMNGPGGAFIMVLMRHVGQLTDDDAPDIGLLCDDLTADAPKAKKRSGGQGGKKKPGRPKANYKTVQHEADLAAKWERARDNSVYKPDFAKDNGMTLAALDRLLDRVAARRKSASE